MDSKYCTCNCSKLVLTIILFRIRLWDLDDQCCTKSFQYPHQNQVWAVDSKPSSESVFMSCGQDAWALLWDTRTSGNNKPASRYALINSVPTALMWSAQGENYAYVGCRDGSVVVFDIRQPAKDLCSRSLSLHRVHRFRSIRSKIAVIGDSCVLNVVKEQTLEPVYTGSANHSKPIRDVQEIGGQVYSIGSSCYQFVYHQVE